MMIMTMILMMRIYAPTPSPGSSAPNNEGNAASGSSKRRNNRRAVDVSAINVVHSQDTVIHLFNQVSMLLIIIVLVITIIFMNVIILVILTFSLPSTTEPLLMEAM